MDVLVNGNVVEGGATSDRRVSFIVPAGIDSLTIEAAAVDTNGNTGNASAVSVLVTPDLLTNVEGVVVDEAGTGLGGVRVQALGVASRDAVQILGLSASTTQDGRLLFVGGSTLDRDGVGTLTNPAEIYMP